MVKCPYCGAPCALTRNSIIYGREYGNGLVWICTNYPNCDTYVGAHDDGEPYGTPADFWLRKERQELHELMDPLWQEGHMERPEVYKWLSEEMGLPLHETHVGMFCRERVAKARAIVAQKVLTLAFME